jgi:hypothetical protein
MEPVTQRARKPYRIFGGGYPPEGVEALWAFHKHIIARLYRFVSFFLILQSNILIVVEIQSAAKMRKSSIIKIFPGAHPAAQQSSYRARLALATLNRLVRMG